MLQKIAIGLICAGTLVSTNTMAMTHNLNQGISIEYELPSKSPEMFMNFTIFTINAVCTIQSAPEASDILHVKGLYSSGKINGQDFAKDDEMDIMVKNGDALMLTANPAARVEITNTGNATIKALCKTF